MTEEGGGTEVKRRGMSGANFSSPTGQSSMPLHAIQSPLSPLFSSLPSVEALSYHSIEREGGVQGTNMSTNINVNIGTKNIHQISSLYHGEGRFSSQVSSLPVSLHKYY